MKRIMLIVIGLAVLWGLGRNIVANPASGLMGLVVLLGLGYVLRLAWPRLVGNVRGFGLPPVSIFRRGRHTSGDTL